jgi:hypothetical protein
LEGTAPSSVSYVSNGWFLTAQHVWENDVTGRSQETLSLGDNTYTIDTSSYVSITNSSGSATDLCMFRSTESSDLPTGMGVLDSTPELDDSLLLIGNGYDNDTETGLTWGDGTLYSSGRGRESSVVMAETSDTTCFLSVYDSRIEGSAFAQTYDSGGGVFVDGELAGIMIAIGTTNNQYVTYAADLSTYADQINETLVIPEPATLTLIALVGATMVGIRRIFL